MNTESANQIVPRLICHVVHRFAVGGIENGIVNLINHLPRSRWSHAVIALTTVSEEFRARVGRGDVTYIALNKGPGHLVKLFPRLQAIFRGLGPQIVHTRNLAALEAQVPAWLASVPIRIHGEHGWDIGDLDGLSRRYQWVRRAYRPFVSQYVALSKHTRNYLVDRVGIKPGRIEQIYNGVDCVHFRPLDTSEPGSQEIPFDRNRHFIVGAVGRMYPVKNHALLARSFVRALQIIPEARATMRLAVIGDGPERDNVASILKEGKASDLAWLPGERNDIPDLLRQMDVFVLPSLAEGISNTVLEAMSSAIPVIATAVGGNPELVSADTGQLVPSGDVEALAIAIARCFRDRNEARKQGCAGRRRIETTFSLDAMVHRYELLYERLLEKRRRTPLGCSIT